MRGSGDLRLSDKLQATSYKARARCLLMGRLARDLAAAVRRLFFRGGMLGVIKLANECRARFLVQQAGALTKPRQRIAVQCAALMLKTTPASSRGL